MKATHSTESHIPTAADCRERAEDARRRHDDASTLNGKMFWRAMEKSWRQTAELIESANAIDRFLQAAA